MKKLLSTMIVAPLLLFCTEKNPGGPDDGGMTTIYEAGGHRGAAGVTVKFFEIGAAGAVPCVVDTTDEDGRFSFSELPIGKYDLWAEKGSFVLFQGPVTIAATYTTLRDDTLEPASSLAGVVSVQYPDDPRTVTIRLAGTDKFLTITDEKGAFTMRGLAAGTWSLQLSSALPEYLPSMTTVTIDAGSNQTIPDTLKLFSAAIPFVFGIRISQDTLAGTITLRWDKAVCKNIMDYVIYKASCSDVAFPDDPTFVTTDTFLVDSIPARAVKAPPPAIVIVASPPADTADPPDSTDTPVEIDPFDAIDSLDTVQQCFRYRIAIRNREQQIGPARGYEELHFARNAHIMTWFVHHVGYVLPKHDYASIRDTLTISLTAKNLTRPLARLLWYDLQKGDTVFSRINPDTLGREFIDTIRYAFDSIGTRKLIAVAIDNAGGRWSDTVPVAVVKDIPVAEAGNDTGVFVGTSIRLHGSATDLLGTIAAWEWKIGAGNWCRTDSSDTEFVVPPSEDTLVCSLTVIDDDGNRASDRMRLFTSCKVQHIAMSRQHEMILKTDGTLWTCGDNEDGQLGDGTMEKQESWVRIMDKVKSMSAGTSHSLILTDNGTVWACGSNWYGQLGDGVVLPHPFPVPVMTDVQSVATGYHHSLALKTDGTLWACGVNGSGQLGDGTTTDRFSWIRIMDGVQSMSAGDNHSLILKTDGTAWTCGSNDSGQAGVGYGADTARIRQVVTPALVLTDVKSVAAGYNHSFFLKNDNTLWACGANSYGQLGDGSMEMRYAPVKVMNNVKTMAAGGGFSLIIVADGTLLANGWNYWGWGAGTWEERYKSAKITGDAQSAAASFYHSLIVKTDGSLWKCDMQDLEPVRVIPFVVGSFSYYEEEE